jgi:hypothetical protein
VKKQVAGARSTHSCCDIVFIACNQLHVEEAELRIDRVELVHGSAQLRILLLAVHRQYLSRAREDEGRRTSSKACPMMKR